MKILMINDFYERLGGLEVYLLNLFKALEEYGHTVVVIYGVELKPKKYPEERKSYFVNFSQPIKIIREAIADIIKKESPDIIHIHNLGWVARLYRYLGKICNLIPVVQTIHGHGLYCPSGGRFFYHSRCICQRRYGSYCLFSMLINRCFDNKRPWITFNFYNRPKEFLNNYNVFKKIIVNSRFLKRCLIENGLKNENIEVLHYFTNIPELKNINAKNTILFLGRIYREKGLDYLIRALQFIKIPFNLMVVGDGDKREVDRCKKISKKLGLDDRIEFLGWRENLEDYYRQASIVVVPSVWPEPFGIVGIEAMSYAKPVVAFDVGGIPEWLEDGKIGFLIEPYNIKEMARKIEILLKDKTLAIHLGQKGRWNVEAKFNKDRHLSRLFEIYAEVFNG